MRSAPPLLQKLRIKTDKFQSVFLCNE
uniref:Uncharacterized protein n=1 Tax=Anguilla anguilla TaxID=7936 RepID=A0A0E9TZ49_ANGAN